MIKRIFLIAFLILTYGTKAQVGIGTNNPEAKLDLRSSNEASPSNTDGLLIPQADAFPLTNPTANQDGLLLYITGLATQAKGFYYWDNDLMNWTPVIEVQKIDDLVDGKSDNTGTFDGSSLFLGVDSGNSDPSTDNKNTVIGNNSFSGSTFGVGNVGLGYEVYNNINEANYNTVIGGNERFNLSDLGPYNVYSGYRDPFTIESSVYSFYSGALYGNRASFAVSCGFQSGSGNSSTTNGAYALDYGDDQRSLVVSGYSSLANLGSGLGGEGDVSCGAFALYSLEDDLWRSSDGYHNYSNVALGSYSLYNIIEGWRNVGIGAYAIYNNEDGWNNIGIGSHAQFLNEFGDNNTAFGFESLYNNINGNYNIALGSNALVNSIGGDNNIGIGYFSGSDGDYDDGILSYSGNLFIGHTAGYFETSDNNFYIENAINTANYSLIYGDFDTGNVRFGATVDISETLITGERLDINTTGVALRVNGAEALWYNDVYYSWGYGGTANFFADRIGVGVTNPNVSLDVIGNIEYTGTITDVSDKRLKENFIPITNASEKLQKIQGYTYNMIEDEDKKREYGVLAQDVQKVFPEMVSIIDENQDYLGVSYMQLIPVLIEAVKEQQILLEHEEDSNITIQSEINTLNSRYNELLKRVEALEKESIIKNL